MANLKQGMSGSEVKELQQKLIDAGYGEYLGKGQDDGIFGAKTADAVRRYQKANGLTVDGIAGKNTLGKLNSTGDKKTSGSSSSGSSSSGSGSEGSKSKSGSSNIGTLESAGTKTESSAAATPAETTTATTDSAVITTPSGFTYEPFTYDQFTYDPYEKSDIVKQADAMLEQMMANKPGAWVDPYKDQYMGYLKQYENRDPFSYDFNSDALYNQYKDQYIQQGQMAMMDAMGQAAAMTGGYGNSYAQTVGQQAYNQQLSQLNEIMPELYGMAYDRYNQEGQDLLNLYYLYSGLSEQDHSKYLGALDNYYKELDVARNYANDLYEKDYGEWLNDTKMDFDTWSANTGLSFDEWAAKTGILSDEYLTGWNQQFTATENEKDREATQKENEKNREFTENQNKLDRDAEIEAAAIKAANESTYSTLNTTDTMTWIKKFESAENLTQLENYTTVLAGIIGPKAAAEWYDIYAKKFIEEEPEEEPEVDPMADKQAERRGALTGGMRI